MKTEKKQNVRRRGRPFTPKLRWPVSTAAEEIGIDRATLRRWMRKCQVEPGEDGYLSTAQLLAVVLSPIAREKLDAMVKHLRVSEPSLEEVLQSMIE